MPIKYIGAVCGAVEPIKCIGAVCGAVELIKVTNWMSHRSERITFKLKVREIYKKDQVSLCCNFLTIVKALVPYNEELWYLIMRSFGTL